ncbi:MAG: hypothetical protein KDD69_13545 [Bdellovibrionales bacterium]|nr:hypothetical protein [Bdellovibrionales bacterium]
MNRNVQCNNSAQCRTIAEAAPLQRPRQRLLPRAGEGRRRRALPFGIFFASSLGLSVLGVSVAGGGAFCLADDTVVVPQAAGSPAVCDIQVRLIRASRDKSSGNGAESAGIGGRQMPKMHALLADVSAQLEPLDFDEYVTIDQASRQVRFLHTETFGMTDTSGLRHVISVSPHEMSREKVHLLLDWTDPDGVRLVSTKMRVPNGQNVMLGSEGTRRACTLVGVKVACKGGATDEH